MLCMKATTMIVRTVSTSIVEISADPDLDLGK
jgi:hypothetical protein